MSIRENILWLQKELLSYKKAKLLIVTKGRSRQEIQEAIAAVRSSSPAVIIGENRVQEMEQKADMYAENVEKHFIGHVQKNKVRKAVALFDCIQSIDSFAVAKKIQKECEKQNRSMSAYLQVNISHDPQKHGFSPEEVTEMYTKIAQFSAVKIEGLMCIPKYLKDSLEKRFYFQEMHNLYTNIIQKFNLNPAKFELSMGMSNDYQIALEEGATLIRIGRGIFERT